MRDDIMLWRGRNVEEMPREELLNVIRYLGRELQAHNTSQAISERALGRVEMLRKTAHKRADCAPKTTDKDLQPITPDGKIVGASWKYVVRQIPTKTD